MNRNALFPCWEYVRSVNKAIGTKPSNHVSTINLSNLG